MLIQRFRPFLRDVAVADFMPIVVACRSKTPCGDVSLIVKPRADATSVIGRVRRAGKYLLTDGARSADGERGSQPLCKRFLPLIFLATFP